MSFWNTLNKPIMVLAPMADVTDAAFRRVIAKYGKPDVMWTEFVSADGLFLGPMKELCEKVIAGEITREEFYTEVAKGTTSVFGLVKDLMYTEAERPIVAQFFTSKPEMMRKAAQLAVVLGFDGVDINMGCPDKSIEKQGAGAAMIKNPKLAQEVIRAAQEGAMQVFQRPDLGARGEFQCPALGKSIPVSVKTRIGYNKNELETWLPALLETGVDAITIHARTRKEMSLVPARWEHVRRAVEIRDEFAKNNVSHSSSKTLILGNGDATSVEHAQQLAAETNADGVMLGRAIFGTPWLFAPVFKCPTLGNLSPRSDLGDLMLSIPARLRILIEHTNLFSELLPHKSFAIMKKHFKAYVHGWDGAKELRTILMECQNNREVQCVIEQYLQSFQQ